MATKPISISSTESSTTSKHSPSSTNGVKTVANKNLTETPSQPAILLTGAEAPEVDLPEKYQSAILLLETDPEKARKLFIEVLKALPKDLIDEDLTFCAACKTGVAISLLPRTDLSKTWAVSAKKDLDQVYSIRSSWDDWEEEEKVRAYLNLRIYLQEVEFLFEQIDPDLLPDIQKKIEDCKEHIPPLIIFYGMHDKANKYIKINLTKARNLFTAALKSIENKTEPDYKFARARCLIDFAFSYQIESNNRNKKASLAKQAIFELYETKETLYGNDDTAKKSIFLTFHLLLLGLYKLFPNDAEIKKKLIECQKVQGEPPVPSNGSDSEGSSTDLSSPNSPTNALAKEPSVALNVTDSVSPRGASTDTDLSPTKLPTRSVTPDPIGDAWKITNIFIVVCACLAVTAAVVFGKRLFSRME